jgi:hypothetical protein
MRTPLLLLFFAFSAHTTTYDEFGGKIIKFDQPYDRFIRAYFGCPPAGQFEAADCKVAARETRLKDMVAACEAAKDLFNLKGACEE